MNSLLRVRFNCDINKPEKYFDENYCREGITVSKSKIKQLSRKDFLSGKKLFEYRVESGYYSFDNETVRLLVEDNILKEADCSCFAFGYYGACKHLLGVLINEKDELIKNYSAEEIKKKIAKSFIKKYTDNNILIKPKKKLDLKIEVRSEYSSCLTLKIKIGDGKQYYSLNSKAKSILNGRNYDDFTLKFGKNLTYDSSIHYFDDIDNELLNFLSKINNDGDIDYNTITVSNKNYRLLMNILEKKEFDLCFDGIIYHMDKISDDYNMNIEIKKNKDSYNVLCDIDNMIIFYNDYKYIFIPPEKKIYKLNKYQQQYISATLDVYNVNIEFDKEDFNEFKKNVLPFIKSDVKLDKELEKEIKITKPSEKICLDIVNNNLLCELKFMYDDKEVDYFDIRSRNIVRDIIYEKEILSRVLNYGFNIDEENSKIYINGFDNAVYFVEEKLPDMLKEYNVYITDRLKNMNIRRKVSAHSSFTIGKDNIMKYSFDMGDIPTKELANILESLNQKKKYHRLKNGDVIDLESTKDDLEQLENFVDELDLQQKDISSGEGILPKYKAIYIDSLKNSKKYKFIETNNLFDELIQKFEKYKDKDIELKEKELKILRDYQKVGVRWLKNIHECGFGGILADEMGLGKSLQIIYFLLEQIRKNKKFKTLIVVPTAILYNWQNEIKKFAPELKYIILDGNKNHRHEILESNIKENIIITTYGILREDKDYYENLHFDVCIIDEAQNIKNVKAGITKVVKKINADTKFALTGTPLENSVLELWSIFDYIMPGYLSNFSKFSKNYNVSDFQKESLDKLGRLNKQISSFMLRRLKKDVIKDLPKKIENNIYIDLNPHQKTLYSIELEKVKKEMDNILNEQGFNKGKFMILPLLTRLRQICIDPSLYLNNYTYGSSKIDNLIDIVKEVCSNGHKILLFSNFKSAIDKLKIVFKKEKISHYIIDGSVTGKKRQELVDKFNSDDTNIFLMTLKAGGVGLNLTSADVVIHLDMWWNPQVENQATDRAHRIGQKNVVEVIKLVAKGTIEERIIELQNKKRKLSEKIIEGEDRDKNLVSRLTIDDIKNLLSFENK